MMTAYDKHKKANTSQYLMVAWEPKYAEKYKEMGFSDEKISGIKFAYEEQMKMVFNMTPSNHEDI
jgi:hypothetical protein